jgi:hypothetical protein
VLLKIENLFDVFVISPIFKKHLNTYAEKHLLANPGSASLVLNLQVTITVYD